MQRDLCAHPAQPRRPRHRLTCTANAAGALLFGLCVPVLSERVVASDLKFSDQTVGSGVDSVHVPSVWLRFSPINISSMLGGGAIGDFNNDGFQDIFVLTGGENPDQLWINNGDGTFTDRAAAWGIAYKHMGVGTAVGDYNDDGWLDIFVTSVGPATGPLRPGAHLLYRNNGNGSFTDVAALAGVNQASTTIPDGFGAAFGDFDLDGDLDLIVVGWVRDSGGNRLFGNNGDGTFTDVTDDAGLGGLSDCRAFAPRFADMDGDRYPELLIAGDFGTSRYLINNTDGTFTDFTSGGGTGLDGNGMGATIADFNGDGLFDWYVTSIYTPASYLSGVPGTGNMLYMSQGNHVYTESSALAGVKDGGWGWGTVAVDFNHDGLIDIFETNGWLQDNGPAGPEWVNERCYVFQNLGGNNFSNVAFASGVRHSGQGRGLANLDYDNDGDQDVVIFSYNEPMTVYRNDLIGPDSNWLRVFLDTSKNRLLAPNGFGAKVLVTAGGQTQVRSIDGGSNYLVQSELSAHFGLGAAGQIDEVRVQWPNGSQTTLSNVAVNQTLTIQSATSGDLDGDGTVDKDDLFALLRSWGSCPGPPDPCPGDLNGDGAVSVPDLLTLLANWG